MTYFEIEGKLLRIEYYKDPGEIIVIREGDYLEGGSNLYDIVPNPQINAHDFLGEYVIAKGHLSHDEYDYVIFCLDSLERREK